MAIAHIASSTAAQADNSPTTGAIDTTGANLLVVLSVDHSSGGGGTVTDSKSNSWTGLTVPTLNNNARAKLWYATNTPTVGSGHTFTFSGSSVFAAIIGMSFSGAHATAPLDQQSGNSTGSGATVQAGSLTPSQDDSLIVAGVGLSVISNGLSIGGGFSTRVFAETQAVQRGAGMAYLIQTTAAAANPTWTSTDNNAMTAVMAVFKPAAGSPAPSPSAGALSMTGTGNSLGFSILMPDEL